MPPVSRSLSFAAAAAFVVVIAACPPPTPPPPQPECTADADCGAGKLCGNDQKCGACEDVLKLPTPNEACLPKCGLAHGIGMPCTKGGQQCNQNAPNVHALFCTIDNVDPGPGVLEMCTGPCNQDSDCDDPGAVCIGDPADPNSQKGCVPASCNGPGEGEGEGEGGEGEGEGEGQ